MRRLLAGLPVIATLVVGCAFGSSSPAVSTMPSGSASPDSGAVTSPWASATASGMPSESPSAASSTPSVEPSTVAPSTSAPPSAPSSPVAASPSPTPMQTPTPIPARTPTPNPTATPSPRSTPTAPPSTGPSIYLTNGSRSSNKVALTFDFGGRVGDALAIVRYLAAQGVHATIFSTGNQANMASTDASVRAVYGVVCAQNGLTIGNHSMTHADFASLAPAQMRAELTEAQEALARACPAESPLPFFRPPGGALGGWQTAKYYEILASVGSVGYSRTVTWDVDTLDWGAPGTTYYRTAAQIVAKVETNAQGGSIVLMHLGGYDTYAAVQVLVPWLRGHGYQLVDLHEMLGV